MKKILLGSLILTASSSLWAASDSSGLPSTNDIRRALARVDSIQGSIDDLIAASDRDVGGLENDRLARNILLKMSENTNRIVDDLDELDQLLLAKKYAEAADQQRDICSSLNKLKSDNQNAKTSADLPDVGSISSRDPQFADISSDIRDTQKVLKCK